jgi:hypothetical protein
MPQRKSGCTGAIDTFESSSTESLANRGRPCTDISALAHVVGDKTQAAYQRSDLFDKRRKMMADWARYCDTVAGCEQSRPIERYCLPLDRRSL